MAICINSLAPLFCQASSSSPANNQLEALVDLIPDETHVPDYDPDDKAVGKIDISDRTVPSLDDDEGRPLTHEVKAVFVRSKKLLKGKKGVQEYMAWFEETCAVRKAATSASVEYDWIFSQYDWLSECDDVLDAFQQLGRGSTQTPTLICAHQWWDEIIECVRVLTELRAYITVRATQLLRTCAR